VRAPRGRRGGKTVAVLIAATLAALSVRAAHAADPFPNPANAGQLACDMAPSKNGNYASWWAAVVNNTTYQTHFWQSIVPSLTTDASCPGAAQEVRDLFWNSAVPNNWNQVGNIGGWPWAAGGYYTQWFWLHAVPEGWGAGAATSKLATGYYGPLTDAEPYYRYTFFHDAVPNNWAWFGNIGGYPWPAGGYYTQWFWLHAVPDGWAPGSNAIGGVGNKGFYTAWFYHFATLQDFAWDAGLSLGGSAGAGYYDYWWYSSELGSIPFYANLRTTAGGYLSGASTGRQVNKWYDCSAQAVVILTFDTEGTEGDSCAVTNLLNTKAVPATFFLRGDTAEAIADTYHNPLWKDCLSSGGFDFANHTYMHPGSWKLSLGNATQPINGSNWQALFDTFSASAQLAEINHADTAIRGTFPNSPVTSFRTPWCDGHKSFDSGVLTALTQTSRTSGGPQVVKADSSVAYLSQVTIDAGIVPQKALRQFAVGPANPYPFDMTINGKTVTEFPFAYPSDWAAVATEMHHKSWSTIELQWKQTFDEIYSKKGVMTMLMHPFVVDLTTLGHVIDYMKSKPNVRFTTMDNAYNLSHRLLGCPP
jgi:peptidoglycan/xylan/chitin deacetylase (PgdA/CDA1 family)